MTRRLFILVCCSILVAGSAFGQAKTSLRTPDGQPDLQGTWSSATITPFERPAEFAGKEFFTEQEAARYEKDIIERTNMDRRDGSAEADVGRAYNDFWWDRGTHIVKTRRTSLVIDPKDGKVPPLNAAGRERQQERLASNRGQESVPRKQREPETDRTLPPSRCRHASLSIHCRRSRDLGQTLDGRDSRHEEPGPSVRVRLP